MDKKKILLVDDSPSDRELCTLMYEKNHYHVYALSSGRKCFEMIELEKPDVVLLDVVLPGEDGNEILTEIRKKYSAVDLPVIMVTAKSDASDVIQSLNLGANDYISKPVAFDVAIKRIETQIQISNLTKQMGRLKELEGIKAIIATYNHEINNPLTIAIGKLDLIRSKQDVDQNIDEVEKALWRINGIIKKARELIRAKSIEMEAYDSQSNMVKLSDE